MTDKTIKQAKRNAPGNYTARATAVDPLIVAGGALAVGAAVGALLPRSDAEKRALAPLGALVSTAATRALHSAREAVSNEVSALPVVGPAAAARIDHVIDRVVAPAEASNAD